MDVDESVATTTTTKSAVVYTDKADSRLAGEHIGEQITAELHGASPDVVIVFSSSTHDYATLLSAIKQTVQPKLLVGCSSAGEFTMNAQGEESVSAVAIRSDEMKFTVGLGQNIHEHPEKAAEAVVDAFQGIDDHTYPYHSALVLADALAGHTDVVIDRINHLTAGTYQLFGGGAGDDAQFQKTHVFIDTQAYSNAVVGLEILSKKPLGIGVRHGWEEASEPMRVTEADGRRLISLNARPVLEVIKDYAVATDQVLDESNPGPFFLHNLVGLQMANGYKLRAPLAINADGSVLCASDIPVGSTVKFMKTAPSSATEAAIEATEEAMRQLGGEASDVAIVFDCVATRLRMGRGFSSELDAVTRTLGGTKFVGCNTYGQVARVDGQFNGFHNCTAVVCIFPK